MTHDVFVSYSSKDKVIADAVVASLECNNIRCWYAPRDVAPGADWAVSITDAIKKNKIMILIFSKHASRSQRVLDELNFAITHKLLIVPFRIEDLEPDGAFMLHLSSRHWLDAYDPTWEDHLENLVKTIAASLERSDSIDRVSLPDKNTAKSPRKNKQHTLIIAGGFGILILLIGVYWISLWVKENQQNVSATQSASLIETPVVIQSTTPTATITLQETPFLSTSTPQYKDYGNPANPVIWMFVPPKDVNFSVINASMEQVASAFETWSGGLILKPIPAPNLKSIVNALCEDEAQIGALYSFAYLEVSERGCAEARLIWMTGFEDIKFGGLIIARVDSGMESIADLEGKSLCIPSYTSTSTWKLPELEILASGFVPDQHFSEIKELRDPAAVVKAVYDGECDAGTTYKAGSMDGRSLLESADGLEELVIIAQTESYPGYNLTFSHTLDPAIQQKLIDFFLEISSTPEGLEILLPYTGSSGDDQRLVEVNDYYYNGLRDLFERANADIQDYVDY